MNKRQKPRKPQRLRTGMVARTDLLAAIDSLGFSSEKLGITHTTSGYHLRDVAQDLKIKPRYCKVFERGLIYTFYGRAAYRKPEDEDAATLVSVYPVVFILDANRMNAPFHVYPFDTGAFANGSFSEAHDYNAVLENFELTAAFETAQRITDEVFGGNNSYLSNNVKAGFEIGDVDNFEGKSYEQIIRSVGLRHRLTNRAIDDRSSAIEIAFNNEIDIKSCIVAAIIPEDLLDGPKTGRVLADSGIEVIPYPWTNGAAPKESYGTIRALVHDVYLKKGWL